MEGGLGALEEAECPLVGGHSIDDTELKFGLAVTGLVHPDRVWLNNTLLGGESMILTKPIGTGLITTAARKGLASEEAFQAASANMGTINRVACSVLQRYEVHACTDVTGFGLIGHACEMAADSPCNIRIAVQSVPLLPMVREYAALGFVPGGTSRNKEFRLRFVANVEGGCTADELNILFDPQTSGGLLAAVPSAQAEAVLAEMRAVGVPAAIIGVTVGGTGMIELA
jgi:selenide,water dikinase